MAARDTSRDGLKNRLEGWFLTHFAWLWRFLNRTGRLGDWVNRFLIDRAVKKAKPRPYQFSSRSNYTSWASLTDRRWSGRHLPEKDMGPLPALDAAAKLFAVPPGGTRRVSAKSTVLFASFAQWFTDGFLMTRADNRRMTKSNHQIDLNPLYGLKRTQTDQLRLKSEVPGARGRLKSDNRDGEEYAPELFVPGTLTNKPEFDILDAPKKAKAGDLIFAFGSDRANTTPATAAINTLFLREHNRVAGIIEAANPSWDDTRVFETARNVMIVILIKIVVEDYINHISPYHFRFRADPKAAWRRDWNQPNWIAIEFNLLYRWHGFIPDTYRIDGRDVPVKEAIRNNGLMIKAGLAKVFDEASRQKACELGLLNTTAALMEVERDSLEQGRDNRIASYNDYREAVGFPRVTRFEQINGDPAIVEALKETYGSVDRIEFFAGLFAEESRPAAAVPSLLGRIVALDAFSQALTNPLLSPNVYNAETFTREGLDVIAASGTLAALVRRNVKGGDSALVTFTQGG